MGVYFADPYCCWQRGTNASTNGLIRQFFPKGTDLARQPASRISQVQELLNHRPRRCLGYRTPYEAFTGTPNCCDSDSTSPPQVGEVCPKRPFQRSIGSRGSPGWCEEAWRAAGPCGTRSARLFPSARRRAVHPVASSDAGVSDLREAGRDDVGHGETRWLVFVLLDGKKGHGWWLWVILGVDTVVYLLDSSRSHEVPER